MSMFTAKMNTSDPDFQRNVRSLIKWRQQTLQTAMGWLVCANDIITAPTMVRFKRTGDGVALSLTYGNPLCREGAIRKLVRLQDVRYVEYVLPDAVTTRTRKTHDGIGPSKNQKKEGV